MPAGRPSKYKPEYCKDIVDWFESQESDPKKCPLFGKYAVTLGVTKSTLHEWRKAHPEFSDAYDQAKAIQEHIMIERGLNGEFNGGFTKFAMANMHGWSDKHDVEQTNKNIEVKIDKQDEDL